MSGISLNPLQKAVFAALASATPLSTLGVSAYDRVPELATYPYLVFGNSNAESADTLGGHRERVRLTLEIYSRAGGKKEVQSLLGHIRTALHYRALALEGGYTLMQLACGGASAIALGDGLTWRGMVTLEALVQC